jgi:DNA invertase Pin-like site-specific DNA recombinase
MSATGWCSPPGAASAARGRLKGRQPKLTGRQQAHLRELHAAGGHTVGELAELFSIGRATVYRVLERETSG